MLERINVVAEAALAKEGGRRNGKRKD